MHFSGFPFPVATLPLPSMLPTKAALIPQPRLLRVTLAVIV